MSALDGVRVLDLTAGLAGPVAGMLLADLGADVVKIRPPGGGPSAAEPGLHVWDRGKRAAVLDRTHPGDLRALDRLVQAADVVLVGTSGGGVTYADLLERGHEAGRPAFWVVMPPYLLGETPWAGGSESAGLLFAWLGHAWSQSSYDDVPVDCLYPLALYMQAIWAATVSVALLAGREEGRQAPPLAVAGGAHGGQLVSPGGFAVGRGEDLVAELREHVDHGQPDVRVVFDDQDGFAAPHGIGLLRARRLIGVRIMTAREREPHDGALARRAVDRRMAAALLDEAEHHAEPEPRAFAVRLGREERFEHALEHVGRHAGARVGHLERHVFAGRQW